ncbi:hypothetical protein [Chloroflexus aggregans]|uniref:Uncharacterized protein n=1 Tax=Chloroflexus aggregans (strain MD-66 / DSM 9485) TaxID=326427 RepID=B8G4X8_CHLAD|nr:hypothetical protein [Chloroflexus aggregans]ACL23611.1 conserved hypothetical protein [Chloroflexus aggregans DSM 9485]
MANEVQIGTLRIFTKRAGTVSEIVGLLQDIETAYNRTFLFFSFVDFFGDRERFFRWRHFWREWREFGFPPPFWMSYAGFPQIGVLEAILPEYKLEVKRIQIESPGFWEFVGALNPLQQIREYLNDRHKRRQDREYREQAERERLQLENELIRRQIWEKENSVFRERINILRERGFPNDEIRRLIWAYVSQPLIALGKHQDVGLIENADSQ